MTYAEALDDAAYSRPTRCPNWPARDLLLHLCDTPGIFDDRLTGSDDSHFNPVTAPQALVDAHHAESSSDVLGLLVEASARHIESLEALLAAGDPTRVSWLYNQPVDWRLLAVHGFWDDWIHERDLRLPAEPRFQSKGDETRLAAAYGLMLCGLGPCQVGVDVSYRTTFSGVGGGAFHLDVTGDDVIVEVNADEALDGLDAALAVDSMAGRGPLPSDALHGDAETLGALSLAAMTLRGDLEVGPSQTG